MISDSKIAEVRERSDIVEIISDYVTLRRAGSNLKGVCPFHADSDPSFNVNPARQFFHCFGCGVSGDVFSFLTRMEGIDFMEAVKRLAGRYGVALPAETRRDGSRDHYERAGEQKKRRLYILEEACQFFVRQLGSPQAASAREALKARGVGEETASKFRLGFAPDSWSRLIDELGARKIAPKELVDVGLALQRKSGNGYYDRFRNRLMFTVTDPTGRPIAFSGRALSSDEAEQGAKYINSPETEDYKKGKVLYGLHQARVPLSKSQEAVLVEGNFDVVSLAGAGIENVVAPLGTALTADQAMLLRRRVESVVVLFDGDSAGRKAAARAFHVLAQASLASYTAPLPAGEDPDSFVRKEGRRGVEALLAGKVGLLDQIISDTVAACDGSAQDKARRIDKLRPFVDSLPSILEKDLYRARIAEAFGVDEKATFRALRGPRSSRSDLDLESSKSAKSVPGRAEERELIGLILDSPKLLEKVRDRGVSDLVSTPAMKRVLDKMLNQPEATDVSVADLIVAADDGAMGEWIAERAMTRLYHDPETTDHAFEEVFSKLTKKPIFERIREIDQQIRLANAKGDENRVLELSRMKTDLQGVH